MKRLRCGRIVSVAVLGTLLSWSHARALSVGLYWDYPNSTIASGDRYGHSVAVLGSNIVIGAPYDDPGGVVDAGSVYVRRNAPPFDTMLTIPNPNPQSGDGFGYSVAVLGSNILVGAPFDNPGGIADAGAAYLFDGTTGALIWTCTKPSPAIFDFFGHSVATIGSDAIVGAPLDNAGASDSGAVYTCDGTTGAIVLTIPNPDPGVGDQFGFSVTSVANKIVGGAPYDDEWGTNHGAVYTFNTSGTPLDNLINGPVTAGTGDGFGYAVAGLADTLLVGAPFTKEGSATNAGRVYWYSASSPSVGNYFPNPGSSPKDDQFGAAVALLDSAVKPDLVVGAPFAGGTSRDGAIWVFDGYITAPSTRVRIDNPTPASDDEFGRSLAIAGSRIVVGAPADDVGATNSGAVHTYNTTPVCGDDWFDLGEQCDWGDDDNGDCCSSTCQVEGSTSNCDNNLCTVGDTCSGAGHCVPGGPKNCDENPANPCTTDNCSPSTGNCSHNNVNNGANLCSDGNPCTGLAAFRPNNDSCSGGVCVAGACDDGASCAFGGCDTLICRASGGCGCVLP